MSIVASNAHRGHGGPPVESDIVSLDLDEVKQVPPEGFEPPAMRVETACSSAELRGDAHKLRVKNTGRYA
jgi:hypothetical protein